MSMEGPARLGTRPRSIPNAQDDYPLLPTASQGWVRSESAANRLTQSGSTSSRAPAASSLSHWVRAFGGVRPSGSFPARFGRLLCPLLTPARSPTELPRPALSSPTPLASGSPLSFVPPAASACDGRPGRLVRRSPVPAFVPEGTRQHPTATSGRSPRIRTWTFAAQPRHLPCLRTRGLRSCCACSPGDQAFYGVSVRRLAALPPASFRPLLAETPLPLASSSGPLAWAGYSCRGLSPHESTPMPGVHNRVEATRKSCAPHPERWANG